MTLPLDAAVRRQARGFSLLELLTVLAILALTAGLIAPRLAAMLDGERSALRAQVIAAVRGGQLEATRRGVPVTLVLDPADNRLRAGEAAVPLPAGWRVERDRGEPGSRTPFFQPVLVSGGGGGPLPLMAWSPSGLADMARWRLVDARGRSITIAADPIDGVRVE